MDHIKHKDCPLDREELGKATWGVLHTMAAKYPDKPNETQKTEVKTFYGILSRTYPCESCAKDLRQE